ncbi:uncharacterized protein LOC115874614 isoform X2 [Sitophilus oryzae]|uniref:Uncharacterized protein LOC115874614 isoform X2 n=1 Tax=Sitophilus oryzae TaxID=7048 RepID=A0A6J2X419_SITOR|nr:uncharacterized protein LOC115874614 isoform X2 [Sitophilus oryzae]
MINLLVIWYPVMSIQVQTLYLKTNICCRTCWWTTLSLELDLYCYLRKAVTEKEKGSDIPKPGIFQSGDDAVFASEIGSIAKESYNL